MQLDNKENSGTPAPSPHPTKFTPPQSPVVVETVPQKYLRHSPPPEERRTSLPAIKTRKQSPTRYSSKWSGPAFTVPSTSKGIFGSKKLKDKNIKSSGEKTRSKPS